MFTVLPIMSAALVAMPNPLSLISTIVQQQVFPLVSANSVTTAHLSLGRRLFSQQASSYCIVKKLPHIHIFVNITIFPVLVQREVDFRPFEVNYLERRRVHAKEASQLHT